MKNQVLEKNMKNIKIIIMAGGNGERLWPKSRKSLPKQFSNIISNKSMLLETFERLLPIVKKDNIFISLKKEHLTLAKKILPDLEDNQFILEPYPKDTACAILFAALNINGRNKNSNDIYFFLPADHYIQDIEKYKNDVYQACKIAKEQATMTLIAIKPHYPATDFGYMEIEKTSNLLKIVSFKEKPNEKIALEYLQQGNYFWNAGMFALPHKILIKFYEKYAQNHFKLLNNYFQYLKENDLEKAMENYHQIEKISFDYAIVEKVDSLYAIKASFTWDDVGSWSALKRIRKVDEQLNVVKNKENAYLYNCKNVICENNNKNTKIIINSLRDVTIVCEGEFIYLSSQKEEGNIKKILKELSESSNGKNFL